MSPHKTSPRVFGALESCTWRLDEDYTSSTATIDKSKGGAHPPSHPPQPTPTPTHPPTHPPQPPNPPSHPTNHPPTHPPNPGGKGKRCNRATVLRKTGLRPVFLRYCWQVLPVCYLPWTPHRTGPLYRTGPMVGKGKRCNRATVLRKTGLRPVFLRYCWQVLPVCYPTVDPT